jgi:RepB DNA-primase N-terminal domain
MPALGQNPSEGHRLTAEEYLKANYETGDHLAVLLHHRAKGDTIQRVNTAGAIASAKWQAWLRHANANGYDVYISQNTLTGDSPRRRKQDVAAIRHVYLDLDQDGDRALKVVETSVRLPRPNFVIDTSPGKHQVIWKVQGMSQVESENLMRAMAREFGGDPAATDSTRVLRLPGFYNKKYEAPYRIEARQESAEHYRFADFKVSLEESQANASTASQRPASQGSSNKRTHSERDWRWVMQQLQQGESPENLIQKLEQSRQDKPNPGYYARLTVTRAYARHALTRGIDPQEVVQTISRHPPQATDDGDVYARKTVSETQKLISSQRTQGNASTEPPQGNAQRLALRMTP